MSVAELTRAALREFPLPRQSDGDKDDHGKLLIIAGSRQVPGAALLCARAALRGGAGKIRIATAASVAPGIALKMVEALVVPLDEADDGACAPSCLDAISKEVERADAIVAGPGMERGGAAVEIARTILQSGKPSAIDAALLHDLPKIEHDRGSARVPPVLLPHSRELAALLEIDEDEVKRDPAGSAREAAKRYGAMVVAKGADSRIAAPDGRTWVFRGGAPGLGVSGSGDALAGITGALLARGAEPLTALLWSVLLHGEAGEMLSAKIGPVGFLAREIPDEIPALLAR